MPIYEYECQSCKKVFERLQSLSAPAPQQCDLCGQGPVRKLISLSGFMLKGTGFYTTDNPSSARKAGNQSEKAPAPAATPAATPPATSTPASTPISTPAAPKAQP